MWNWIQTHRQDWIELPKLSKCRNVSSFSEPQIVLSELVSHPFAGLYLELLGGVRGYERAYEVSDRGNARSLDRVITMTNGVPRPIKGRVLRPVTTSRYGYRAVSLGRGRRLFIHRLVAAAFLGLKADQEVDHMNGDTTDNSLSNLRCVTHAENMRLQRERKPLCQRGHRYDEVGFWNANGRRECGECRRIRERRGHRAGH